MCVLLKMVPAKGMTLLLISYGGSSSVAIGIAFGMILAISKQKYTGFLY